jgi:hypothetical protein
LGWKGHVDLNRISPHLGLANRLGYQGKYSKPGCAIPLEVCVCVGKNEVRVCHPYFWSTVSPTHYTSGSAEEAEAFSPEVLAG